MNPHSPCVQQTDSPWIDYASPGLRRRPQRTLNGLALYSLFGSLLCIPLALKALADAFGDHEFDLAWSLWPLLWLLLAVVATVQVVRKRATRWGARFSVAAIIITSFSAIPIVGLSDYVCDRQNANCEYARQMLTVENTWTPPAGAKVVRARFTGFRHNTGAWYEIQMPPQAISSYRSAVLAKYGTPVPARAGADRLSEYISDNDPSWWDPMGLPDPSGLWFKDSRPGWSTRFVFSATRGVVFIYSGY